MARPTTYFAFAYNPVRNKLMVLATFDDLDRKSPVTDLGIFDPKDVEWRGMPPLEGIRATSVHYDDPGKGTWLLAEHGEVWALLSPTNTQKWQLPDSGTDGRHLGQPNQIRMIGGRLFVCGFAGQVYTLTGSNWTHMDDRLAEPQGTAKSIDLTSIDGTAPDDLYVCGSGGLIAHWDGAAWTRIPVVANGRRQLGFIPSLVDPFLAANKARIEKSAKFTPSPSQEAPCG